jgi:hypothetical protein
LEKAARWGVVSVAVGRDDMVFVGHVYALGAEWLLHRRVALSPR